MLIIPPIKNNVNEVSPSSEVLEQFTLNRVVLMQDYNMPFLHGTFLRQVAMVCVCVII